MPAEIKKEIELEIGHILFIDIVGYSKLLMNEQRRLLESLNQIVRSTEQFGSAEASGRLIKIPTGDGMALVFYNSPETPVECALEISRAVKEHPELRLRMGVHSGPVSGVVDVSERANVAGAGINTAQRVMDCGDAGHILLSKHVAEDLEQFEHWQPHLHELGECEVKHGVRVSVVNLYTDELGNAELPERFRKVAEQQPIAPLPVAIGDSKPTRSHLGLLIATVLIVSALLAAAMIFLRRPVASTVTAPTPAVTTAPGIPEKSIAVLPFENLSEEKANAFFADGVQDEILTNLARIADLKVISRTSVMQYKTGAARNLREIGQQLGVAHLLEGSVQRAAGKVRVNAQLIDARNDAHLWAQSYDRDLADVFAIQSEIAKTIADQLQAKLSRTEKAAIDKPPTTDLTAYDLYLRAQVLFADTSDPIHSKEKLPKAARLLDEAVARDPNFLLGWCLLSRVHCNIYFLGFDHTPARLELANAAVQTALRLQPDAGEAHLALAEYYYYGFRDYDRARAELAIARRTLPNNAEVFEYTGYIDRREGHWEESTRNLERALELDPRNFFTLQQLGLTYHQQRRYADESRTLDRALTIMPGDPGTRMSQAQLAFEERADIKPMQSMLATLIAEDPTVATDVDSDPQGALCERTAAAVARALTNYPRDGVVLNGVNVPHAYWEGVVARWQDDQAKAQAAFTVARTEVAQTVEKQPDFPAGLSLLGMTDAGLGRKEEALREGRRACELLPISKDAILGVALAINLAQIYAWTGEKDLAIEQVAAVERVPNLLSYGYLKLSPIWDALRGDPRFEKIVASLAPKQ
jgi:TolB-like protein/class 3 adenylate cyclase/cytochrome c-type biogenesis protein CcmH/NrfG